MYAAAKATDIVQHFFFVIIIIIDRQTDRHHRFHSKPVDQPLSDQKLGPAARISSVRLLSSPIL
jgi:hypothetical protein